MFTKGDIVLIDTNVILEAHRVGCWISLSQYFNLHTVEKVIEETQTGFQNRNPEQTIDQALLRKSFNHVQTVTDLQVVEFDMTNTGTLLDDGEKQLIIYSQTIKEKVWYLNSPDLASVKYSCQVGSQDRLISLESMIRRLDCKLKNELERNFTESWLSQSKLKFLMGIH